MQQAKQYWGLELCLRSVFENPLQAQSKMISSYPYVFSLNSAIFVPGGIFVLN